MASITSDVQSSASGHLWSVPNHTAMRVCEQFAHGRHIKRNSQESSQWANNLFIADQPS